MANGLILKEVVGVSWFDSTNGKRGYNIHLKEDFRADEHGVGYKVSTEFTYDDYQVKPGDRVIIQKDVINGKNGAFPILVGLEKVSK